MVLGHQNGQPNSNEKLAGFRCRKVTLEDLPALEKLGEEQHFDIGLENLELYYKTSPTDWNLIENDQGECVAYENVNRMPNGINFGFQIIVREDLRGLGLTRLFEKFEDRLHMGNATEYSILRWRFRTWHWRLIGFFGIPNAVALEEWQKLDALRMEKLSKGNLNELIKYDKNVTKVDRTFFLTHWCLADGNENLSRTSVVRNLKGKVVGFGTLRKTTGYYTLSPLYADSDQIAKAIIANLVAQLSTGDYFYFKCLANRQLMVACANDFGLVQTETEMQHYFEQAEAYCKSVKWPSVYCVHEFWPV